MFESVCAPNSWIWIFVFAIIIRLGVMAIMVKYYHRSRTVRWLQAFTILATVNDIATVVLGCTTDANLFSLMVALRAIGGNLNIIVLIMFTIHFINKSEWLSKFWVSASLVTLPSVMLLLFFGGYTTLPDISQATYITWGYQMAGNGSLAWLALLYGITCLLIPVYLLGWYYRRLTDPLKRREVNIFRLAVIIPIVVGIAVEAVLPPIINKPPFPISAVLSPFVDATLLYAIIRYGLRAFNVNDVVNDVTHVMPGGVIVLDHTQTIQYVNQKGAELLGYKPGQLVGASVKKLLQTSAMRDQFQSGIAQQLLDRKEVVLPDTMLTQKSGKAVPVSINAARVQSGTQLTNIILVISDISPLKTAEQALAAEKHSVEQKVRERTKELAAAQAELLTSISGLPFGLMLVNTSGQVTIYNKALVRLLGRPVPADPKESKRFLREVNDSFGDGVDITADIAEAKAKRQSIERRVGVEAHFYRFYFSPVITEQGQVLGSVVLIEDQTEARAQERSRDEFFSIASHELRTPLTGIRGNAEMMLDFFPEVKKNPELKQMVDDMHDASTRLITIVNDFLDASRLEQGRIRYDMQHFDVNSMIAETLREFDVTGSRRHLYLAAGPVEDSLPKAYADPIRTRQILVNLIGNSLKFTSQGGITITASSANDHIKISVTDTGKGIPAKSQHLLFHKFQQATDNILTRDSTRSTGLGLYIAKFMAEDMGGKLYLEQSQVGKGSTFALELPLKKQPKDHK
jgi:PAS domain S-box-containing protein